MKNTFDKEKIASITGTAYQDDESFKSEGGFVPEYVPETEEPERRFIYQTAKDHYDKVIYLLQRYTGIHFNTQLIESMAENYAAIRAYNFIDANYYNIPWFLLHSYRALDLYHMLIRKDSDLYRRLTRIGVKMKDSYVNGHVYVESDDGYYLTATNYCYSLGQDDHLQEFLKFAIVSPNEYINGRKKVVDRFSIKVDSYHFGRLVNYDGWIPNQKLLDIASRYMSP